MALKLGVPLGIGLWILVGAIVMMPVGILAGFLFTWSKLEQDRDVGRSSISNSWPRPATS